MPFDIARTPKDPPRPARPRGAGRLARVLRRLDWRAARRARIAVWARAQRRGADGCNVPGG